MSNMLQNRRKFLSVASLGAAGGLLGIRNIAHANPDNKDAKQILSKVESIKVTMHHNSKPRKVRDALQSLPGIGYVKVHITSDDGITGVGFIGYGRIKKSLETTKAVIENELAPLVIGSNLSQIRKTYEKMRFETDYHGTTGLATVAIAGIDTALWDCLGKTLGVPCWQIWGGYHDKLPVYGTMSGMDDSEEQLRERCEKAISLGYRALKIKIGYPTLKEDLAKIKMVRRIVGDDIRLMVDANQVLTSGEAVMRGKAFEDMGCYWFEEPIAAHDLEGYERLAAELTIQIATGENLFGAHDFARFIKNDAVDIIQPDLRRGGGPTALMEIGHLAHAFNIPYASHGGGPAHLNVMACLPNVIYVEIPATRQLENGMLNLPQNPGFGQD